LINRTRPDRNILIRRNLDADGMPWVENSTPAQEDMDLMKNEEINLKDDYCGDCGRKINKCKNCGELV
jgi:hypothetical protein